MTPEPRTKSPRTNYGRLRDASVYLYDPKVNWALRPRDRHTVVQKRKLENDAFSAKIAEINAKLASLVS